MFCRIISYVVFLFLSCRAADAIKLDDYVANSNQKEVKTYVDGYIDSIYNNIYFFGGCLQAQRTEVPYEFYRYELNYRIKNSTSLSNINLNKMLLEIILEDLDCNADRAIKITQISDKKHILEIKKVAEDNLNALIATPVDDKKSKKHDISDVLSPNVAMPKSQSRSEYDSILPPKIEDSELNVRATQAKRIKSKSKKYTKKGAKPAQKNQKASKKMPSKTSKSNLKKSKN